MIMLLWILGLLVSCGFIAVLYQKIDLFKMLILGCSIYFCIYTSISGLLVWINHFNIMRTQILTIIATVVAGFSVLIFRKRIFSRNQKKRVPVIPKISFNILAYLPLALIMIILAVLSNIKTAGAYCTGQDEGLYQARAMFYIGDKFDDYIDFDEYNRLTAYQERDIYHDAIDDMQGFNFLSKTGEASEDSVIGVFHGVATFPALLALWGKMFGLTNMNGILTLMLLLIVANSYLIAANMRMKRLTCFLTSVFVGFCPLVMWSSKNVLTEIVVGMFLTLFYELITERSEKNLAIYTALPIVALSFTHITTTLCIPLIVVIYFVCYSKTKQSNYLVGLILSLIGYAMGFSMMMYRARSYANNNLERLYGLTGFKINENNIEIYVWAFVYLMILAVILGLAGVYRKPVEAVRQSKLGGLIKKANKIVNLPNIFVVATIFELIFFVSKAFKVSGQEDVIIMKMSSICYLITTGFIIVPCAYLVFVLLRKRIAREQNKAILAISMLYIMFVYCGVGWVLIWYYYYYARYFMPFAFIIILCGMMFLDYFSYRLVVPICAVCIGLVIYQSRLLYSEQDNTYCSYANIESFTSCIGDDDAVIILNQGMGFHTVFALPIAGLTDADVYYATPETLSSIIAAHRDDYDYIYIALYDIGSINEESGEYRYVFRTHMTTSEYDSFVDRGMPYAKEATVYDSPIALLIYQGN